MVDKNIPNKIIVSLNDILNYLFINTVFLCRFRLIMTFDIIVIYDCQPA